MEGKQASNQHDVPTNRDAPAHSFIHPSLVLRPLKKTKSMAAPGEKLVQHFGGGRDGIWISLLGCSQLILVPSNFPYKHFHSPPTCSSHSLHGSLFLGNASHCPVWLHLGFSDSTISQVWTVVFVCVCEYVCVCVCSGGKSCIKY